MENFAANRAPAATARFATNSLILRALGEQIRRPSLLRSLCLTSKLFYSEFIVFLYRELDTSNKSVDLQSPNLIYVKVLLAKVMGYSDDQKFNTFIQQLLAKTTSLETFVWPCRLLMPATMLTLRQSCRRLMQVHYYEQTNRVKPEERSGVSGPFIAYDFSGFGNLQSLVLGELHDGLAQWKHRVARILLGTPGLESLELSLSASTVFLCPRYSVKLFDNMCDEYASIGGHPLRLRSLRCGRGIYPMNRVFLSKLTGTSQLEDVQICNAPVNWLTQTIDILYPFDNCHSGIVFDAFGPEHCPNLRRFIVSRYQLNVHEYLCAAAENPGFARRLAFFLEWPKGFGYGEPSLLFGPRERRQDPSRHLALPIQLRAFGVDLERPSISETDRYLWRERVFDDIVTSNADSLKGLLIWIQRLRAHLAEPFGAEKDASDDIEKLARAVGRLPLLRELALVGCWQEEIQDYPGAAQRLAKAVSTLVYVSINEQLWQIQRLHSGEVEVEELEEGEVEDAELFYHYAWRIYRQKLPAQPRPFCISSL